MISTAARQALLPDDPVTLVYAPPGLGAWNVVTAWAREQPCAVHVVASDGFTGFDGLTPDGRAILLVRLAKDGPHDTIPWCAPPPGWRVIAVHEHSRSVPREFDPRVISGCDLLLSREECADLLTTSMGRQPDSDLTDSFMSTTHGWPHLVAVALTVAVQPGTAGSHEAMEYAVRQAVHATVVPWLAGFPDDLVDYLAATGEVAFAEIDSAFGPAGVAALTSLAALGVLRSRPHRRGALFAVSAPLRESLADRLASADQDRRHTTLRLIARTRFALGVGDQGAGAALELRDWKLLIEIVTRWWIDVQFDGNRPNLYRALISIPEPMLRSAPVLAHLAEGAGLLPTGSVPVAVPVNEDKILQLATGPGARGFTARSSAAISARRWRGHLAEAHRIALRASAVLDQTVHTRIADADADDGGIAVVDLRTYWYLHAGLACELADDPASAVRMYRQGWRDQQWDSTGFAARDLAMKFAVHCAVAGDLHQARLWLTKARDRPDEVPFASTFIARSRATADYILALDELDPTALASGAAEHPDRASLDEQWVVVLWAQVRQALVEGRPTYALALLEDAPTHHPLTAGSEILHARVLRMLQVEVRMALGQGDRARSLARQDFATQTFGDVTAARLALLTGDPEGARAIAAKDAHGQDSGVRAQAEASLILASAALALGSVREAAEAGSRATALITGHGLRSSVLAVHSTHLEALVDLCEQAKPLLEIRRELPYDDIYPASLAVVRLTERETVVLAGLHEGLLVEDLAKSLFVSPNTVKTQMRTLYAKIGANSREEAIRKARELGLV